MGPHRSLEIGKPGDIARQVGPGRRPIKGGLNTVAACKSADARDPLLGLRLGCGSGLCWKLEHCRCLTFEHVSKKHDLPVWKIPAHHAVFADGRDRPDRFRRD
jgi:hypothetical protein